MTEVEWTTEAPVFEGRNWAKNQGVWLEEERV